MAANVAGARQLAKNLGRYAQLEYVVDGYGKYHDGQVMEFDPVPEE